MMTTNNGFADKISMTLERVFLTLLGFYLFYLVQRMTTFNLFPLNDVEFFPYLVIFFFIVLFAVVLRTVFLFLSAPDKRKSYAALLACGLAFSTVWLVVFLHSRENVLYFFPVFWGVLSVGCIAIDYKRILKLFVFVVGGVILSAALCSIAGMIKNLVYWDWNRGIRSAWGIDYCTDMAAYYVFLCLAAWVAWDHIPDRWFLVPAGVSLLISSIIVQSKTSDLCLLLLMAILVVNSIFGSESRNGFTLRSKNIFDHLCSLTFPVLSGVMLLLLWKYIRGDAFAIRIDGPLNGRLAFASAGYESYGIHAFGSNISFVGFGREVTSSEGYNYIDSSYHQLILCYGLVPFLMMCVLWPVMTLSGAKRGDRRLSIALAIIAVHSMIEQRFLALDYNIFIILPFSILSSREQRTEIKNSAESAKGKTLLAAVITTCFVIAVSLVLHRPFLAFFRTVCHILNMGASYRRRFLLLLTCMAGFHIVFLFSNALYGLCHSVLHKDRPGKKDLVISLSALLAAVLLFVGGEMIIDRFAPSYDPLIESERPAIEAAQTVEGLPLYVDDFPVLYDRKYGGISSHLYSGYDLGRLSHFAVITYTGRESYVFQNQYLSSFQISDVHMIYTDSKELAQRLALIYG